MDRLSADVERLRSHEVTVVVAPAAAGARAAPAAPAAARAAPAPEAEPPLPSAAATLRVNADTLDDLINEAGEVAIARSRVEAELRAIKQSLADLSESVTRMRSQLREVEVQADSQMQSRLSVMDEKKGDFDPLEFDRYTRLQELTRLMAESLNDIGSIQQGLQKNMGDTDAALQHQARINREVQQELMRVRAVPFANLNERLYRIVRQVARELGKKAELEVTGAEVELDRGVLERISAPLEHMLRNALVHGIEDPAARVAAGKAESGRIAIALRQESNEIALVFSDDGAGLDLEALRRKGAQMGLLPVDREPTEGEIAHLVFASGLSTAEKLSELAGRGVGMDVVKNDITSIGGRVDIVDHARRGHHLHGLPAAHAGGDPSRAGAQRRQHDRARLRNGRAGAAAERRRPRRALREPQDRIPGAHLPAAFAATASRRERRDQGAGVQLGAAAAQRHPARGGARGRAARQP